jgi:hypothetical protein
MNMLPVKMTVRNKILSLPVFSGVGAVLILLVTVVLGVRGSSLQHEIQYGYAPSLELARDVDVELSLMQRKLQDAVAAADPSIFEETDSMLVMISTHLDSARGNPVLADATIDSIADGIRGYYEVGRRGTAAMISGEVGESTMQAVREMSTRYKALRDDLTARIEQNKADTHAAFASAARAQTIMTWVISLTLLLGVGGLFHVSRKVVKDIVTRLSSGIEVLAFAARRGGGWCGWCRRDRSRVAFPQKPGVAIALDHLEPV